MKYKELITKKGIELNISPIHTAFQGGKLALVLCLAIYAKVIEAE